MMEFIAGLACGIVAAIIGIVVLAANWNKHKK